MRSSSQDSSVFYLLNGHCGSHLFTIFWFGWPRVTTMDKKDQKMIALRICWKLSKGRTVPNHNLSTEFYTHLVYVHTHTCTWRFPEMGYFHYKQSILGCLHFRKPAYLQYLQRANAWSLAMGSTTMAAALHWGTVEAWFCCLPLLCDAVYVNTHARSNVGLLENGTRRNIEEFF